MLKKIALVTDNRHLSLSGSERLLGRAFTKHGYKVESVSWEDPRVTWKTFHALFLRSCWNYPEHYGGFLQWVENMAALPLTIWNPPAIIRWNSHKKYLKDLQLKGISIIPTLFIPQSTPAITLAKQLDMVEWPKMVVKPAIGNEAKQVKVCSSRDEVFLSIQDRRTDWLIQKWIKHTKEYSLVFFRNQFSHAVTKNPKVVLEDIPGEMVLFAKKILALLPEILLYARVDLIRENDIIYLMELELIEPYLFLEYYPQAADTMAQAFLALEESV